MNSTRGRWLKLIVGLVLTIGIEAARYLGGHWLEEYAWLVAEAEGLQDARCSAIVRWEL